MLAPNTSNIRRPIGPAMRPMLPGRNRDDEIDPTLSASDGSFSFSGLRAGKYSLSASKRGYSQQTYEQHEMFSTAIVVGPDKESSGLLFRLQPDASISGHIVDDHNEAVGNAQVMLFREGMQNGRRGIFRTQQVQSSDEGYYHFAHVRSGKFYIVVSATPWYSQYAGANRGMNSPGILDGAAARQVNDGSSSLDLAYPLTFYPGVTDAARAEALDLKPGQRETVDFSLMAIPALHVRVTTPQRDPQQFVTASVMQQIFDSTDAGGVRSRYSNSGQGVTEISGIAPGHYILQLHSNSNGPNRNPAPSSIREIDVNSNMDINLSDTPSGVNVTGILRFDGPAPADSPRLVLRRRNFPMPVSLQVGAKGEITSESPVQADTYDIALPMNGYQISHVAAAGAKVTGQTLQIGSNDVRLTVVAAKASGRVEGVALKDGKPQAGVMIVLLPEDMDRPLLYRRDQSDSDGSFTLSAVTPGKYTVLALENGWDLEWSKPEVLKPFLGAGEPVQVAIDGKYDVKLNVQ